MLHRLLTLTLQSYVAKNIVTSSTSNKNNREDVPKFTAE